MAPKRKDGGSSKPASKVNAAAAEKAAADAASDHSGDEEGPAKKPKFVKENPGMTAKQFEDSAKPIILSVGDNGRIGTTGSYGWKGTSKLRMKVDVDGEEKEVLVQVGVNMTVSGSKPDAKKASKSKRGRPKKSPASNED